MILVSWFIGTVSWLESRGQGNEYKASSSTKENSGRLAVKISLEKTFLYIECIVCDWIFN